MRKPRVLWLFVLIGSLAVFATWGCGSSDESGGGGGGGGGGSSNWGSLVWGTDNWSN